MQVVTALIIKECLAEEGLGCELRMSYDGTAVLIGLLTLADVLGAVMAHADALIDVNTKKSMVKFEVLHQRNENGKYIIF